MDIYFNWFLIAMAAIAAIVFVALFFVKAGYGVFFSSKWGPSISNRWGWVIMEAPVFIVVVLVGNERSHRRCGAIGYVPDVPTALLPTLVYIPLLV